MSGKWRKKMAGWGIFLALCAPCLPCEELPCLTLHGRAYLYGGDGQLRIWHIGTHHDFAPDETSSQRVEGWLEAGVKPGDRDKYASPASMLYLYADSEVCPVEPFKKESVQSARILSARHRVYRPAE